MFDSVEASPEARPIPQPGELWSLWDMLRFNASDFQAVSGYLHRIEGAITQDKNNALLKQPVGDEEAKTVIGELRGALTHMTAIGADVTGIALMEIMTDLEKADQDRMNYETLADRIAVINSTLRRELSLVNMFVLSREKAKLYQCTEPLFGQAVFDRFAVANDDIAEAGNCLALQRGTASVFHLMRIMEAGLKALGGELGIPYAPSWESYIRQLDTILDTANYKSLSPEQKKKRPFYQDVLGDLISIKSAWRNPTMHIVRSYDAQQAGVVFEAVKALMQRLASELSADPSTVVSTGQSA